jgi:hypothetical protein
LSHLVKTHFPTKFKQTIIELLAFPSSRIHYQKSTNSIKKKKKGGKKTSNRKLQEKQK